MSKHWNMLVPTLRVVVALRESASLAEQPRLASAFVVIFAIYGGACKTGLLACDERDLPGGKSPAFRAKQDSSFARSIALCFLLRASPG
jgi:hypothetical protein